MTIEQKKKAVIEALKAGKTLSQIGKEIFHSTGTARINSFIDRYGIPVSQLSDKYRFMNRTWLAKKINELGSPSKVASAYGFSRTSVTRYAERYELYTRKFTRKRKNEIEEHYFDTIDNANKAYWLGLIMADANIYHYKDGSDKVQFELKLEIHDKPILMEFAKSIGFPPEKISEKHAVRKNSITQAACLRTYNKVFCASLEKYGIVDRKSGKEIIPKGIPTEYIRDFIRGFWDGDGNICDWRVYVASLSFDMIAKLSSEFAKASILTYVTREITSTKKSLYELYISAKSWKDFKDYVYYDGCLGMSRKIESANKLQSTKFSE